NETDDDTAGDLGSGKPPALTVLRHGPGDALGDLALARSLLTAVRDGRRGPTLRIYRPSPPVASGARDRFPGGFAPASAPARSPTVAFGARDRFLGGFAAAIEAARSHGFTPALRTLGARVAAYHPGSLVVDHIEPTGQFLTQTQDRFVRFGQMYAAALRDIGVDARMGEIPGEYCPGRSEEHTSELQSRFDLVCRLLLEKKNKGTDKTVACLLTEIVIAK